MLIRAEILSNWAGKTLAVQFSILTASGAGASLNNDEEQEFLSAMHVVVIGAGLLGVTSAYFLRQHGVEVTVLESEPGPALGASYANGGYLQASAPDPWNAPGVFKIFAQAWINSIMGKGDRSAFATRTVALPSLMVWGLRFLRNANRKTFLCHLIKNMRLAQYTKSVIDGVYEQESFDYSTSKNGGLVIFRSEASMAAYEEIARYVGEHGARFECLNRSALIEKEASLSPIADELVGAVHFPDDGAGDSRLFCEQLAKIAEKAGVVFNYDSPVQRISGSSNTAAVNTSQGEIRADAVVIAAGVYSKKLISPLGINLPIAPAKGYSISIPMGDWSNRPSHVIADMGVHAGINPMGDVLRVAGTAEFAGMRQGITPERTEYLIGLAKEVFPEFARDIDPAGIDPWGGHRPLSVDGIPMIGPTQVRNVYVNTGHGGLGWTQSAGSSKALADKIVGAEPEIALSDFSVDRFN